MKTSHKFVLQTMFIMVILAIGSTPVVTADYTTGNNNLTDALNASLKKLIDSGDYDTIYGNWFSGDVVLTDDTDANTATTFPAEKDLDKNGTLERIIAAGEIVFGSDTTYPPFESIENSKTVGFDVDIGVAIAAELSKAYDTTIVAKFQTNDWDPIIPDLKTGKFDAILSAMTKTAVRAQEIDFTRSYYTSKQAILAGPDSPTITGIEDLNAAGIKIAVQSGTTSDLYAKDNLAKATISAFIGFDEVLKALENGDVDFLLGDLPVLGFYSVEKAGYSVVGSFGDDELFGIGVRKDTGDVETPFPSFAFLAAFLAIPLIRKFKK